MTEEGMEQHAIHGTIHANMKPAGVLNVADFPGKWKDAKLLATEPVVEGSCLRAINYEKARQFFLELGGEFVGQVPGKQVA
jgi:hypothetical protein